MEARDRIIVAMGVHDADRTHQPFNGAKTCVGLCRLGLEKKYHTAIVKVLLKPLYPNRVFVTPSVRPAWTTATDG